MKVQYVDGPWRGRLADLPDNTRRIALNTSDFWGDMSKFKFIQYRVIRNPLVDSSFTHIATVSDNDMIGREIRAVLTIADAMLHDYEDSIEYAEQRMRAELDKVCADVGLVLADPRLSVKEQWEPRFVYILTCRGIALPVGWDQPPGE